MAQHLFRPMSLDHFGSAKVPGSTSPRALNSLTSVSTKRLPLRLTCDRVATLIPSKS